MVWIIFIQAGGFNPTHHQMGGGFVIPPKDHEQSSKNYRSHPLQVVQGFRSALAPWLCSGFFNQNVKPWWSFTWYLRHSRFPIFRLTLCFFFKPRQWLFLTIKRVVVLPRLKNGNLIWWTDLYWWDGTLAMKRADGLNQIWQLEKLEALTILNMRNTCKIL